MQNKISSSERIVCPFSQKTCFNIHCHKVLFDIYQKWCNWWWRHQAITWTNVDLRLLTSISAQFHSTCARYTNKKYHLKYFFDIFRHLPRDNELIHALFRGIHLYSYWLNSLLCMSCTTFRDLISWSVDHSLQHVNWKEPWLGLSIWIYHFTCVQISINIRQSWYCVMFSIPTLGNMVLYCIPHCT